MSDAALFTYDGLVYASRLTKPYLMIHSDQCAVPSAARRHFAVSPAQYKQVLWEGQTRHLQYYEDEAVVDETVCNIVNWFSRHVRGAQDSPVMIPR